MEHPAILLFELVVFIFSIIIHEVSHGYVAEKLGDPTARLAGRLTLNPIKHIDAFGSIMLPILMYFMSGGQFVFGWAKPVPYNPQNLKHPTSAAGKIAGVGPLVNILLALIFGLLVRGIAAFFPEAGTLSVFFGIVVKVNVLLAVFNLVPIPPLDGSKVLFAVLPEGERSRTIQYFLERYGLFLLLFFIFFGFNLIIPVMRALYGLFTGQAFGAL